MGKFDGLFSSTPAEVSAQQDAESKRSATISLQMSLWRRLSPGRTKSKAGALAWMLLRLGQPEHRDHADALEAIESLPDTDLAALLSIVRGAAGAARPGPARELADRIVEALVRLCPFCNRPVPCTSSACERARADVGAALRAQAEGRSAPAPARAPRICTGCAGPLPCPRGDAETCHKITRAEDGERARRASARLSELVLGGMDRGEAEAQVIAEMGASA